MTYVKSLSTILGSVFVSFLFLLFGKQNAFARDREEDTQSDSTNQVIIDFQNIDPGIFDGVSEDEKSADGLPIAEGPGAPDADSDKDALQEEDSDPVEDSSSPDTEPTNQPEDTIDAPTAHPSAIPIDPEAEKIKAEKERAEREKQLKQDAEVLQRELGSGQDSEKKGCLPVIAFFMVGSLGTSLGIGQLFL